MDSMLREYHEFNTFGIQEDLVSDEDKEQLRILRRREKILPRFNPDIYVLCTYDIKRQNTIFNGLRQRQGNKCNLSFTNSRGFVVRILYSEIKQHRILLNCFIVKTRVHFRMWLTTFLDEYRKGNITEVKPEGFADSYLLTVAQSFQKTLDRIAAIKAKYNQLYEQRAEELKKQRDKLSLKYPKLNTSRTSKKSYADEDIEKICKPEWVERLKTYWNTKISENEKKLLLDWISKNIYSIRVYGVIEGRSGKMLTNEYSEIEGVKLRDVKKDSDDIISNDHITAHISFKDISQAPREILEKVVSPKRKSKDIFYNNRLNDTNLALFLLMEYKDKGFKAGVRNLYKNIKV